MKPEQRQLSDVDAFLERARKVGIYKKTNAQNLSFAFSRAVEQGRKDLQDVDSLTVGGLREQIDALFSAYGGSNDVTASSVASYKARALKLIDDFIKHVDDDDAKFMKWKAAVEKPRATKSRRKRSNGDTKQPAPEKPPGSTEMQLALNCGTVALSYPTDLTTADAKKVKAWLEAAQAMIAAQATVYEDDDDA